MRALAGPALAAVQSSELATAFLVELQLSETLRLNTTPSTIDWGGFAWTGAGALGSIDEIDDAPGPYKPLRLTLSGIGAGLLPIALAENIKDKPAIVRLAICSAATWAVLDVPTIWRGICSQMPVAEQGELCTISVIADHPGALYARPKPLRMTDEDHRRLYPADTSHRFIASQANKVDAW